MDWLLTPCFVATAFILLSNIIKHKITVSSLENGPIYILKIIFGPNNFRIFSQATHVSVGDMPAMLHHINILIINKNTWLLSFIAEFHFRPCYYKTVIGNQSYNTRNSLIIFSLNLLIVYFYPFDLLLNCHYVVVPLGVSLRKANKPCKNLWFWISNEMGFF